MIKRIVVLTGAGVSAESGLSTYRDSGGTWDNYDPMVVASIQGWYADPRTVLDFYNGLRTRMAACRPNSAHLDIAALEKDYDVTVITQNVDDLHERAGSKSVLHLHGELMKVRSLRHEEREYTLPCDQLTDKGMETSVDTLDPYGDHVRPHIVFFGEAVPNMEAAAQLAHDADIFVVIGTSLVVYPAAALIQYVKRNVPIYYIDPRPASVPDWVHVIPKPATQGVAELIDLLRS